MLSEIKKGTSHCVARESPDQFQEQLNSVTTAHREANAGPDDVVIPFTVDDSKINGDSDSVHSDRRSLNDKGVQTSRLYDTEIKQYISESCLRHKGDSEALKKGGLTHTNKLHLMDKTQKNSSAVIPKYTKNEEAILDTLLKHYKCNQVRGIRFTWLGIYQFYRVILVICNTYITEPLPRLWAMTTSLMLIAIANTLMKPYKDDKANKTAILSYAANPCIAMINVFKTGLVTFDCKINCSVVDTVLWYFTLCEKILLIYLPVVALAVWLISIGVQKSSSKDKKE